MKTIKDEDRGRTLLNAVERILDDTGNIITVADRHARVIRQAHPGAPDDVVRDHVARRVVRHYAKATAISGGVTALPAIMPGLGTLTTLTGGTLVDTGLMLKFEVEMALALCHVFGYDITDKRERELAFLLASVSAYDIQSGTSFLKDVAAAEGVAIWNYAPRQVPKILVHVMTHMAARGAERGLLRAVPVLGVVVGTVLNKTFTERVGRRCIKELAERQEAEHPKEAEEEVVEAVVAGRRGRGAKKTGRPGARSGAGRRRGTAKRGPKAAGAAARKIRSTRGASARGAGGTERKKA